MSKTIQKLFLIFLAGVFALLPMALTIAAVFWLASAAGNLIGPDSFLGKQLINLGLGFGAAGSYVLGITLILMLVFLLGVTVRSRFGEWLGQTIESLIRKCFLRRVQ